MLYSGGQVPSNHHLHRAVVDLAHESRQERGINNRNPLSMTYFPFCSDGASVFFNRAVRRYQSHGVKEFTCLKSDEGPSKKELLAAFESDIIYLAGGNTFYFLKHLRESGALPLLKKFANQGKVIAGLSAGALIMSPTVALAADPGLGPDENDVKLKDFKALNLFPFEFSPHYDRRPKEVRAHLNYSLCTPHPVYAISDGSGIVIRGDTTTVHGQAEIFMNGLRYRVG